MLGKAAWHLNGMLICFEHGSSVEIGMHDMMTSGQYARVHITKMVIYEGTDGFPKNLLVHQAQRMAFVWLCMPHKKYVLKSVHIFTLTSVRTAYRTHRTLPSSFPFLKYEPGVQILRKLSTHVLHCLAEDAATPIIKTLYNGRCNV